MINSVGMSPVQFNTLSAMSSVAAPEGQDVQFSYNPQDQVVMQPSTTVVKDVTIGKDGRPSTDRVRMDPSSKSELEPSKDGGFVFDQKTDAKSFAGAHTFATVAKTLEMFENACGSKIPWAFHNDQMRVVADGGEMLNAYYSRGEGSVNFFHANVAGETVYSGTSGEVVSHEVGHAMLDGLRPNYLRSWNPDPGGFHESFADMTGFFMATQNDDVCDLVAQQTGGDMHKPNCLAATGEELGRAINTDRGKNSTGGDYIRNAINDFKWQDPSTLPDRGDSTHLGTEMHSFSRLWTGAIYDVYSDMVSRNMEGGMSAKDAIKSAGSECITLYGNLMKEAPKGDFTYEDMAKCLLKADAKYMDGKNHDLIATRFSERGILKSGVDSLEDMNFENSEVVMQSVTLDGGDYGMFNGARFETPVDSTRVGLESFGNQSAKDNMAKLIKAGRILYTEPNQVVQHKDLFDKDGMPYMGVVRWVDGEMFIQRNEIIN